MGFNLFCWFFSLLNSTDIKKKQMLPTVKVVTINNNFISCTAHKNNFCISYNSIKCNVYREPC